MPITQSQMLSQIQESRAALATEARLRENIRAYATAARERYYNNAELREAMHTILLLIDQEPTPSQHVTYCNERYYHSRGKYNVKSAQKQEQIRRAQGVPTRKEYNAAKGRRDQESREIKQQLFAAAVPSNHIAEFIPTYQERPQIVGRSPTKLPRTFADDKPLEFDGPTGQSLQGENNSPSPSIGLDIPADLYDDGNGN